MKIIVFQIFVFLKKSRMFGFDLVDFSFPICFFDVPPSPL